MNPMSSDAPTSPEHTASSVCGVWELVSLTLLDEHGTALAKPMGRSPSGRLIYTADGYMSVHLTAARDDGPTQPPADVRPTESILFTHQYIGYCGTYRQVGDEVTHDMTVASVPHMVGAAQRRLVRLDGELLTLTEPLRGPRAAQVVWRRLPTASGQPEPPRV
jgi:hypothetical protein